MRKKIETFKTIYMKLIYLILILSAYACTNVVKRENNNALQEPSSEFDIFYSKFITDSVFQIKHIKFPLGGMIAKCDTSIRFLEHSNWIFFSDDIRKEESDELNKIKKIQTPNSYHFSCIREEVGLITEIRFEKKGEDWFLVYLFVNAC